MPLKISATGLSPLARGTQNAADNDVLHIRFIPAGAGNTKVLSFSSTQTAVYPRWRGEHVSARPRLSIFLGLSPLARGTLNDAHEIAQPQRFIPAGAGNTFKNSNSEYDLSVYPRWRGEHKRPNKRPVNADGLSPLARGTLDSGCVCLGG
ncbi:Hypothetical protein W5S_0417 [Pectobacterium parmentieri]|uniref:Uncharacterized protein n=1 Tax=Pectobacterium parmentieri TaxID=1905730 RepID=A0A0H3HYT5_PECPM|nr:Hypothetical protein W5S_0417 [Pectobacterium parmentieri]